jgi:S-adenosyl methyltransferase
MADQPGSGPDVPASAPVYDYWADGKDHYRPDRELADGIAKICPGAPGMATYAPAAR